MRLGIRDTYRELYYILTYNSNTKRTKSEIVNKEALEGIDVPIVIDVPKYLLGYISNRQYCFGSIGGYALCLNWKDYDIEIPHPYNGPIDAPNLPLQRLFLKRDKDIPEDDLTLYMPYYGSIYHSHPCRYRIRHKDYMDVTYIEDYVKKDYVFHIGDEYYRVYFYRGDMYRDDISKERAMEYIEEDGNILIDDMHIVKHEMVDTYGIDSKMFVLGNDGDLYFTIYFSYFDYEVRPIDVMDIMYVYNSNERYEISGDEVSINIICPSKG